MNAALTALRDRGFIQQCTDLDALDTLMNSGPVTFYIGFDPTGRSLHAGHMIPLFAMCHLARSGHRPVALIGGGTARIGDPSGKTEMRKMLTVEQITENGRLMGEQIKAFLAKQSVKADYVDNSEWLAELNYIEFLRDIGKHFSVNRMLSFETYKMRMETGLSFIEFNYQLLQSYDFLVLNRDRGCRLQAGGDDQWGNIVAGVDLIRRVRSEECYGLTFPLVTRADGKKMGKTEKGAVFLDPNMFRPYEFFQYWRNVPDQDVEKLLKLYTFLPLDRINELAALRDREINTAKETLATELTTLVHGEEEADKALSAARAAFGRSGGGATSAAARDTSAIPEISVSAAEIGEGINVLDLFARTDLCESKSEARRLVSQGGARINDEKVGDIETVIDSGWVKDSQLVLRAGKKRYFRVVVD